MHKAVFVDRDGTLNEMVYDETHGLLDSPRRPEQVALMPGAGRFLSSLRSEGYRIDVVTNQPGIAKGTLSLDQLNSVNDRLAELLIADGGKWDDLHYCPHHPTGDIGGNPEYICECDCRKPQPGLIVNAAEARDIDLASSWMVGDGFNDIQAGRAAGCRTILVAKLKAEHLQKFLETPAAEPDATVETLDDALRVIREEGRA
jgi:D-glycero-D-manno-heptose 1,7-bisphosphate phosphatase